MSELIRHSAPARCGSKPIRWRELPKTSPLIPQFFSREAIRRVKSMRTGRSTIAERNARHSKQQQVHGWGWRLHDGQPIFRAAMRATN